MRVGRPTRLLLASSSSGHPWQSVKHVDPGCLIGRVKDTIIWAGRPTACSALVVGLALDRPLAQRDCSLA